MKTLLFCLSLAVLALFAIALPRTDASGTTKEGSSKSEQRDDDGFVRVAQARPAKEKVPNAKTGETKGSARKEAARKGAPRNAGDPKPKRLVPITAEMESKVREFVREHHRELLDVLAHLKDNVPKEYERAVRELSRQRLHLKQLEGRDRYSAELDLWKAQSRVRLLGAKFQMGVDESLRDALREKLAEAYDLRAAMVQRDRDRAEERLKKLDEQLQTLRDDRDKNLDKQLLALTRNPQKRAKSVKTSTRKTKPAPGSKTPAKTSTKTPAKTPTKTPTKKSFSKTID